MMDRFGQLSLFSTSQPTGPPAKSGPVGLSAEAARQMYVFALRRLEEPAGEPLVSRLEEEISELKHLVRKSAEVGGPGTPLQLSLAPRVVARLFNEPGRVHRRTVSSLWQTFREFINLMVQPEQEATRRIDAIDRLLIPRRVRRWYQAERTGGGYRSDSARDRRLLFAVDLLAITVRAKEGKRGERAVRDQALVALCCWSGLRFGEILFLRWEGLEWEQEPEGKLFPLGVRCPRRGADLVLPVHANARGPLTDLYALVKRADGCTPQGLIFRAVRQPNQQLGMREAKYILDDALERAGFPGATLYDLRAALADHLQSARGVTDLELTQMLGYGEHKHTRRLLEPHRAWRLNQKAQAAEGGAEVTTGR